MGAQDLITAISGGLIQQNRLLKLDTPLGGNVLLPQRAIGRARVGRHYELSVDVVSASIDLELKNLIAQPICLWLRQSDRSYLPRHGYIHTVRRLGSDGGLTSYQIRFSSWMHFLKLRKDARVFHDQTGDEILSAVFNHHPQAQGAFRFELRKPLPQRSFCVQYEDDWNFCHRLMESEGLFCHVEHAEDGKSHRLVITDDVYSLKSVEPVTLQFSRAGSNTSSDAWVLWSGSRKLHSASLSTRTFDYKSPGNDKSTNVPTLPTHGNLPFQAEVYEYTGAYTHLSQDRGDHLSKVRMEEWESRAKRFTAVGGARNIDAGKWFELRGHPEHDRDAAEQRQFVVIEARWYIENNLPVSTTADLPHSLKTEIAQVRTVHAGAASAFHVAHADRSEGFYLVEVEAQRRTVPFRSPLEHPKPIMNLQTATVAGPASVEVHTDELNRIKVLFHWDRLNSGDENASCWVRVAYSDTGSAYGGVHVPRVGEEVIVSFIDGDCDRPIVTGRVFNSGNSPHWHSNGLLSGYKSKEYGGAGYNQLVMDDASGQNRVQLYSTSTDVHLHLGYLIEQSGNTRGSYLGSGFDLKTDAYGAIRAGRGLYMSTHAANGSSSQPLDVRGAQQQLVNSESVIESLSNAGEAHQAESLVDGRDSLKAFADATQNSVSGASSKGRTAGGGMGTANAFNEPVMLLASPAGIALSTQRSTHVAADEQINIVSGQNTHMATGKSLVASVAQKLSVFVQNAGMKVFAAKGKVEIQAHSDNIELSAQKTLRLVSATEKIEAAADQDILLTSGGAYIRISGGNIEIHAPGNVDIKGSQHSFNGPASTSYPLTALPTSGYDTAMQYLYHDDEPVQGAKYVATLSDGSIRQGTLDMYGRMSLEDVPVGPVKVELGPDSRSYARKDQINNPDFKSEQLTDASIDSLIQKHGGA
ncbi:type VI secretion system Vgr family protein [Paraburkholderia sp. BCC1884]|uniref:type VI secretion system Vgr family protein n=1 Tax=Paraburkholderia sp. BCC1884 TaxID=2562668 RepID=UPI001182E787|nr:type VI secretion system tip protein VgrG [Paraburkholderia sp. BCC1884]